MMKTRALLFALLVLLPACSRTKAPDSAAANSIKIGVFLSLTGSTAAYGISSLNAIKLATDEINHNGGIDGQQIELVIEDDHSNTQEVPAIVTRLIQQDQVHALLAEPISTRAMTAAPIAQQNQVVMISSASVKSDFDRQ